MKIQVVIDGKDEDRSREMQFKAVLLCMQKAHGGL